VRRVAASGSALDSSVVSQLVGRRRREDPLADLSRARDVLELMAEGLSNIAIAARIVITERADEKHVASISQKLHLPAAGDTRRRVLAVLTYLRSWDDCREGAVTRTPRHRSAPFSQRSHGATLPRDVHVHNTAVSGPRS